MPILAMTRSRLLTERLEPAGDGDHRLVRELVEQGVHDPVARPAVPEHDHVKMRAAVVEVEMTAAERRRHRRMRERRRIAPVGLFDPPVDVAGPGDERHPQRLVVRRGLVDAERRQLCENGVALEYVWNL